jgi:acyl-CoA thioester hydrolase
VVFNAHYVAWFDLVMTELWREAVGGYSQMLAAGTDMVVAEVGVRFLGSAGFDDLIDLEAVVSRLGDTGMTTRIAVSRQGEPVAEGELRHVFVDPRSKQKKPIPELVRRGLEPYVDAPRPAAA